ncbi:MAG: pyruvate formate-lyase, partial [Clostridia bacterium]|nr:pyruvate formate-lyase [Clostridia bacterium]
ENMTTLVMDDELIVGTATNKYRGANLHPEFQSASEFYLKDIDEFPVRKCDPYDVSKEDRDLIVKTLNEYWIGRSMEDMAGQVLRPDIEKARKEDLISVGLRNGVSGETTCDHERLLKEGLKGYIEDCKKRIAETVIEVPEDQARIDFWNACIIQCEGLITYAHIMGKEAERQAAACTDEKRRKELLTIAENCKVVPENPPQNFWQALQLLWFVHVYFHIEVCTTANGFGRFDQYMWPFYKKDVLEDKTLTKEEALELLECLYLKSCEVYEVRDRWYASSFAGYPMWQILVVGGQDAQGNDATNDLSYLCLDAAAEMQTTQPVLALRVCKSTPADLIRKGCEMVQAGMANPGFFNDEAAMKMTLGKGCSIEEARDWTIVGCIQPGPGGGSTDGSPDAGYVNSPKVLELVLHNGIDPATGDLMGLQTGDPREFKDIEELKDAVKKQLVFFYEKIRTGYNQMQSYHALRFPVIFASMVTKGCVESGKSVQEGGAKYYTAGMFATGTANLSDSLVAIDQVVFKDKTLTMDQLINILDKNFEGEERIRQLLINKPPKFGNDDEVANGMYNEMIQFIAATIQSLKDARGGYYSFSNMSQTVNVSHGAVCGATADGRLKGEAFNDNASPMMGRDISGPTATVKSVGSMGQENFHDGALFNIRFDPNGVAGEKGLQSIEGIIRTFFDYGGEHIQINVVDDATLRAAQKNPEKYKGLMVRVAGYMAYFTELDEDAQNSIIYRTTHFKEA